jgi:hypothetical protein
VEASRDNELSKRPDGAAALTTVHRPQSAMLVERCVCVCVCVAGRHDVATACTATMEPFALAAGSGRLAVACAANITLQRHDYSVGSHPNDACLSLVNTTNV